MVDDTRSFGVGTQLAKLKGAYPRPQDVLEAVAVGQREKAILARLWISEGIPFAFRRCPGLYEEVRALLAKRLELDAKQISVVGSGRLGYSMAPSKWGKPYEEVSSDLDLFAVSEGLFQRLREDFECWRDDFSSGAAQPSTAEQDYWNANSIETPKNIRKGFIGSKRVPNREKYGEFFGMNGCLADIWIKLQNVDEGPKPRESLTLRCYRDWPSYESQMTVSLQAVVERSTTLRDTRANSQRLA